MGKSSPSRPRRARAAPVRLRHLKDIAAALTQKVGEPVDKRKIVLDGDIKKLSAYEVEVKVYPKVTAKLTVKGGGISSRAAAGRFSEYGKRARNARE